MPLMNNRAPESGMERPRKSRRTNFATNGVDADTVHVFNEHEMNGVNGHPTQSKPEILTEPLNSPRPLKVICIGAGVSGLLTAIKVKERLRNVDFQIFEKNDDLGGTWLENRYPGCACDVPAHAYAYTFEPNPDYSRYYVGSVELHNYLKGVAAKHKLKKYITYQHKLTYATWSEENSTWNLTLEKKSTNDGEPEKVHAECNILINACGLLNRWKWPAIPGLDTFKGYLAHSANWQEGYDFKDKVVAVIGSGSSAIQIDPELQPVVKHLEAYIRSPTWIAPSQGFVDPATEGPSNFHYTEEDKKKFREDPEYFLQYRKKIEADMNRTFDTFMRDSPKQQTARVEFAKLMLKRLGGNQELAEKLTPKFGVGCRRLTPGIGFLETLVKDNVTVISQEIDRIEPEGLVTADGQLHKVDAIVCATGFDTSYDPRFELRGRGESIKEKWTDTQKIEAYLAMAIPSFPNYFMFMGPNAPLSNGTLIPVLEMQSEYMMKFINKSQRQGLKAFEVKESVVKQLNAYHQTFIQRMVFSENCRSWYKAGRSDGKVIGIWPGSSLHYYETISEPRYEDFEYTYRNENIFTFLGNGWTEREVTDRKNGGKNGGKEDLAWYLKKPEVVMTAPGS